MKYVLAAMAATIVVLACLFGAAEQDKHTLKLELQTAQVGLEQAAKQRKLDAQVLVARQAEIASEGRKLAQARQALSAALQRNKGWSGADVPTDVIEALAGGSGGSNAKAD